MSGEHHVWLLLIQPEMGMFSVHRKRIDGAGDNHDPSTPIKSHQEEVKYTAAIETPPSSSKLGIRPPTPVPACPPPQTPQTTTSNLAAPPSASKAIRPSGSNLSLSALNVRSPSSGLSPRSMAQRFPPTPPLPDAWTGVHDHAMCVLDTCNYSLGAIVKKLRSAFPELANAPLTQVMIDKRLRVLDQNPEIDYFRTGLNHANHEDMEKARRGKAASTEDWDTRIPADPRVSTLTAPTSTIDSSDASIPSLPSLPERVYRNRRQSELSLKTIESGTSQGGLHTEPFGPGFLSHRHSTLGKEQS